MPEGSLTTAVDNERLGHVSNPPFSQPAPLTIHINVIPPDVGSACQAVVQTLRVWELRRLNGLSVRLMPEKRL